MYVYITLGINLSIDFLFLIRKGTNVYAKQNSDGGMTFPIIPNAVLSSSQKLPTMHNPGKELRQ